MASSWFAYKDGQKKCQLIRVKYIIIFLVDYICLHGHKLQQYNYNIISIMPKIEYKTHLMYKVAD